MADIIVTGGAGFIGRHLVAQLHVDGHNVHSADSHLGDITEVATWRKFPDANVVVHLAARSFVPDSWNQPAEYLHTNLLGTVQAV